MAGAAAAPEPLPLALAPLSAYTVYLVTACRLGEVEDKRPVAVHSAFLHGAARRDGAASI